MGERRGVSRAANPQPRPRLIPTPSSRLGPQPQSPAGLQGLVLPLPEMLFPGVLTGSSGPRDRQRVEETEAQHCLASFRATCL